MGARRCFIGLEYSKFSTRGCSLVFGRLTFTFGTLDSPDLGLSIDGGARFVASELRCGWAGEGTRFGLLRPG